MEKTVDVMNIAELPAQEMLSILRQGSLLRLPHLEGRLQQAQKQIIRFETTYGLTFAELAAQGLPNDADYQTHEDFIEWEYWQDVHNETQLIVKNIKKILIKAEEVSVFP